MDRADDRRDEWLELPSTTGACQGSLTEIADAGELADGGVPGAREPPDLRGRTSSPSDSSTRRDRTRPAIAARRCASCWNRVRLLVASDLLRRTAPDHEREDRNIRPTSR